MQIQSSPTFKSGVTAQMVSEIRHVQPEKISREFFRHGIQTDFKNNKTLAWCALKCLQLIQSFNSKYNLQLGLPKGIFVEDFSRIDVSYNDYALGLCNLFPAKIYKDNDVVVPEKTIFYNQETEDSLEHIDLLAEFMNITESQPDSFFLIPIMHEFAHVIHENHLINKLGGNKLLKRLDSINPIHFYEKYFEVLNRISSYATSHPLEAVACDLSERLTNHIDRNTLVAQTNPFSHSPYCKSIFNIRTGLDRVLNKFWNGKFD